METSERGKVWASRRAETRRQKTWQAYWSQEVQNPTAYPMNYLPIKKKKKKKKTGPLADQLPVPSQIWNRAWWTR